MWYSISEKFPEANKNIKLILSGGKSIHAKSELYGTNILLKKADGSGTIIDPKTVVWWSEINDPAPPRQPCKKCTGRW